MAPCQKFVSFTLPSIIRPSKPALRQKRYNVWKVSCHRCRHVRESLEVAMRDGSAYLMLPQGWRCIVNKQEPHSEDDPFFCAVCFITAVCLVPSGPDAEQRITGIQSIYCQSRRKLIRKPRAVRKATTQQLDLFKQPHKGDS